MLPSSLMKIKLALGQSIEELKTLTSLVENLQPQLLCTDKQLFEITLILEELCANVIHHGGGDMEVELEKEWEELVITVRDTGPEFDPTKAPEVDIQEPLEKRTPGGLGIHLIRRYSDEMSYHRMGKQNIVTVKKTL